MIHDTASQDRHDGAKLVVMDVSVTIKLGAIALIQAVLVACKMNIFLGFFLGSINHGTFP